MSTQIVIDGTEGNLVWQIVHEFMPPGADFPNWYWGKVIVPYYCIQAEHIGKFFFPPIYDHALGWWTRPPYWLKAEGCPVNVDTWILRSVYGAPVQVSACRMSWDYQHSWNLFESFDRSQKRMIPRVREDCLCTIQWLQKYLVKY